MFSNLTRCQFNISSILHFYLYLLLFKKPTSYRLAIAQIVQNSDEFIRNSANTVETIFRMAFASIKL